MAKTAKVKKRQVTVHSRAARRAASPSLHLPKSAQKPLHTTRDSASPSRPSSINPHALAAKDAGIQKRQKKSANMTRAQRLRHQKGLERAEENMDKLANKRLKSLGKGKKVTERAKGWEDVNGDGSSRKSKRERALDDDDEGALKRTEREWVSDQDMDEAEAEGVKNQDLRAESKHVDVAVPQNAPPPPVDEDEML